VPFDENDDRRELEAFMVGETRPDGTSRLVSYEITSPDAPGPVLVASGIAQNEEISSRLTLLDDSGSTVQFGDLLLLPIADSILWIRPLYVAAEGSSSVPTLEAVIATVGEGEQIAIGEDLNDALGKLFDGADFSDVLGATPDGRGDAADDDTDDGSDDGSDDGEDTDDEDTTTTDTSESLLAQIIEMFEARDAALAEDPPDRVTAATLLDQIAELLERAAQLDSAGPAAVDPGEVDA